MTTESKKKFAWNNVAIFLEMQIACPRGIFMIESIFYDHFVQYCTSNFILIELKFIKHGKKIIENNYTLYFTSKRKSVTCFTKAC